MNAKIWKKTSVALGALSMVAVLAGCGGGGGDAGDRLGTSNPSFRALNAQAIGPALDVDTNGTQQFTNVAYPSITAYKEIDDGTTTVVANDTGTQTQAGTAAYNGAKGHRYTALVFPNVDTSGNGITQVSVLDDPYDKGLLSTQARVRVVNASYNATSVDVYITAPGADLTTATPTVSAVAYQTAAPVSGQDALYLDGGSYEIRVTDAGSKTVIFDSGTFAINNNDDFLIATVPDTGVAAIVPDDIRLLVAEANNNQSQEIVNTTTATTTTRAVAPVPVKSPG